MKSLQEFRRTLPVYNHREQIIKEYLQNQILIIAGETGCGKTTQIPQYIYENNPKLNIVITQPRRVAAITIAQRVAQEKESTPGALIGYSVRFDDCFTRNVTKIKYVTDGMLIREFILEPSLKQYDVIIIDEAHERTVQSDLLLALLKQLLTRRKELKLIVMSATLEIQKFSTYLNSQAVFQIEGRTFPIDIFNSKERQSDYIEATVDAILQIHFEEKEGDILAFLPGQEEIEDAIQILNERILLFPKDTMGLKINPLYSALSPEVQLQAFELTPPNFRKAVIATNIAETSITINGIKYVVDSGFVKVRSFQQQKAIDTLLVAPISKAQAMQRAGRAGRQSKGKCFRLYTKETYEKLSKFMLPEILRMNLQNVVLQMKAIGIKNVLKFDFIDQPDIALLLANMNQLQQLNALDEEYQLTQHGQNMSLLPLEPQFSHLLLKAREFNCLEVTLNVVAVLEVENLFHTNRDSRTNLNKLISKFTVPFSDHLTKAKIFTSYEEAKNKKSFCKEHFLNQKALKKAQEIKKQLQEYLSRIKINSIKNNQLSLIEDTMEQENGDLTQRFLHCLSHSLKFKLAFYSPTEHAYKLYGSSQLAYIHPESVLFILKEKPQYLVYNEVVMTKKVYLRDITQVPDIQIKTQ